MHIHCALLRLTAIPPKLFHQITAAERHARSAGKNPHQLAFGSSQAHTRFTLPHFAAVHIIMHLAQMHDLWQRGGIILRRDSAQDCIETQQQLFGLKGLAQIVIRASLKPDDPILGLTLSGQ